MAALYLFLATAFVVFQSVFRKIDASSKKGNAPFLFNSVFALCSGTVFLVSSGFKIELPDGSLIYLPLMIITYIGALLFAYMAVKTGPLSLTSITSSLGLLIPILYGIIAYKERPGIPFIIGLLMLSICIVLVSGEKKNDYQRVNLKWAIFNTLSIVFGGSFSTVQNVVGRVFVGKSNSGIMTVTLLSSAVAFFVISIIFERKDIKERFKSGVFYMAGAGICNGSSNLFVMLVIPLMSASILYPVMSVSSLITTLMISTFAFKERLSKKQWIGIAIGVISALLMNLK